MKKSKKVKYAGGYSGPLAEKIDIKCGLYSRLLRGGTPTAMELANWEKNIRYIHLQKLPFLYAHFRIDQNRPGAGERLALALACQYVPGFQTADVKLPGRPQKDLLKTIAEDSEIARLKRKGLSERSAAYTVACKAGKNPETVYRRRRGQKLRRK